MDNSALKPQKNCNFNNMTDEELHEWSATIVREAQRENYVNSHLEIVRHYRNEALSRRAVYDIERNAINAAIARHGLTNAASNNANANGDADADAAAEVMEQEAVVRPPPARRQRLQQPESSNEGSNNATGNGIVPGHFVAMAHIFSDAYAVQQQQQPQQQHYQQ